MKQKMMILPRRLERGGNRYARKGLHSDKTDGMNHEAIRCEILFQLVYFWMYDPNMTMEEYIKLEEEKARRRGRVFNWQTPTYGKIKVNDDLHDLSSMEAEFPTRAINDGLCNVGMHLLAKLK
ncbi:hypothetical protein Tco_0145128 [Tanacetum coccineum]